MKDDIHPILTDKIIYSDGCIWFAHYYANLMFRIDIKNNKQRIYRIPYKEYKGEKYSDIICREDKIWLIPRTALHLVIFDLRTETFSCIEMSPDIDRSKFRFGGGVIYGGSMYTIPNQEKCKQVSIRNLQVANSDLFQGIASCYTYSCVEEGILVAVSREHDGLIVLNLENKRIEILFEDVFKKDVEYVLITCNCFLFVFGDDFLFRVSLANKTIEYKKKTRLKSYAHLATIGNKYIVVDYLSDLDYEVYSGELNLVGCYKKTKNTEEKCVGAYWAEWCDIENDSFAMLNLCKSTVDIYNIKDLAKPYNTITVGIDRNDIENAAASNIMDDFSTEWYWNSLDELIYSL